MRRIKEADVLIFDVSGGNRNVYFELGCAFALKGVDSERVYVFSDSLEIASDLSGLMLSKYQLLIDAKEEKSNKSFGKLADLRGFRAALVSTLKEIASERNMIGQSKASFEDEDESENQID